MMFFSLIGLLFLIIPLAYLLASLVGLFYLWYRVYKGKSGGDLPICAKCGYAVRGLMGLDCPECGADLREVGIMTPKQRGAVSPVMFVLLWTLLLPGPSCFMSGLLVWVGPQTSVPNEMLELTPNTSGAYQMIHINYISMFSFGSHGFSHLTVEGNAQQHEYIEFDPVAMTYEDWSNVSSTTTGSATSTAGITAGVTKPLDRQALLDLFNRAGANISDQAVIDEVDELLTIINQMPTQGLGQLNPTHFNQSYMNMSYDQPAVWFIFVLLGLWVVVWVGGLVLFFRIRRRHSPDTRHVMTEKARFAPSNPGGSGGPPSTF